MPRFVLPLKKADDPASVGVKSYVLGILFREGFPVPDGFLINNKAYRSFLVANNLESRILDMYNTANMSSYKSIETLSAEIRKLILESTVPEEVEEEIIQAYKFMNIGEVAPVETIDILRAGREQYRVILRPSVDSKFNFPGLFDSKAGAGIKNIIDYVKQVWASLHSADAILYRNKLHINHDMDMCVMVQREIESEKAGISIGSSKTLIESVWGTSKSVLKSIASPDIFVLTNGIIESKRVGKKRVMSLMDENGESMVSSGILSERMSLSEQEALKIGSLVRRVESFFKNNVIIEWAIDGSKLYLLQCRSHNFSIEMPQWSESDALVKGLPVSQGYTSGKIRFHNDGTKNIIVLKEPKGHICMGASAVVCETGSYGSSTALLCREMEIPALFGAEHAADLVKEGQKATLDCYEGRLHVFENDEEIKATAPINDATRGYWIETPGAAMTMKGINKEDTIFFDIERVSRLMFGPDYSMELTAHDSVISLINSIREKCDNVFIFWRKNPEGYVLSKLAETGTKNIIQAVSKDVL